MTQQRIKDMMAAAELLAHTPFDLLDEHDFRTMMDYGNIMGGFMCGVRWADRNPESPWIHIEDRMPEDSFPELSNPDRERNRIKVMVRLMNGMVMEAERRKGYQSKWYFNIPMMMRNQITHWMPIPPLPEEIRKENRTK